MKKHLALTRHIALGLIGLARDTFLIYGTGDPTTPDVRTILRSKGIRVGVKNTRLLNVEGTGIIRIKIASSSIASTGGKSSFASNNVLTETSTSLRAAEAIGIVVKAGVVIA